MNYFINHFHSLISPIFSNYKFVPLLCSITYILLFKIYFLFKYFTNTVSKLFCTKRHAHLLDTMLELFHINSTNWLLNSMNLLRKLRGHWILSWDTLECSFGLFSLCFVDTELQRL